MRIRLQDALDEGIHVARKHARSMTCTGPPIGVPNGSHLKRKQPRCVPNNAKEKQQFLCVCLCVRVCVLCFVCVFSSSRRTFLHPTTKKLNKNEKPWERPGYPQPEGISAKAIQQRTYWGGENPQPDMYTKESERNAKQTRKR